MFKLEQRFKIVEDTLTLEDPWGQGILFRILREDSKAYQRWLKGQREADPLVVETMKTLAVKSAFAASKRAIEGEAAPSFDEMYGEAFSAAADKLVNNGKIPISHLFSGGQAPLLDRCVRKLVGWSNLVDEAGQPIARTDETARALLETEVQIEEGYGVGLTLGDALQKWIEEMSVSHAVARALYVEGAEKNSDASSAGS